MGAMSFSNSYPRPWGMLKQVVLAQFEAVVIGISPKKISKCFENQPLLQRNCQKSVKNVFFPKFSWTVWDAQTDVCSAFGACGDALRPSENSKML